LWPLAWLMLCVGVVKAVDLVLFRKKGLALAVVLFAAANAALVLLSGAALARVLVAKCVAIPVEPANLLEGLLRSSCMNVDMTIDGIAVCAFVLTLLLYLPELHRGIKDVGFVGAALQAERRRRHGI
jgi:hypothetical protein